MSPEVTNDGSTIDYIEVTVDGISGHRGPYRLQDFAQLFRTDQS
jgi:hypothetical protein